MILTIAALGSERQMASPGCDIMVATDQCPVGKGEGKAIGHGPARQVEEAFEIAGNL